MKLNELEINNVIAGFRVDLSYLKEFSHGDPEFEKDILESSMNEAEEKMLLLHQFISQKNFHPVRGIAHSLKSLMSVVGASSLHQIFHSVENCRQMELDTFFQTRFHTIHQLWEKTKVQIEEIVRQQEPVAVHPMSI